MLLWFVYIWKYTWQTWHFAAPKSAQLVSFKVNQRRRLRSIKQKQRGEEREEEHKDELFTFVNCTFSSFCVFGGAGGWGVWFTQSASRRRLCGFGGWTVMWFCGGKCWLVGVLKQEVSWSCCLRWRHSACSRYINRNVEMSLDCTLTRCQVLAGLFFFLHLMFGFFLFFVF